MHRSRDCERTKGRRDIILFLLERSHPRDVGKLMPPESAVFFPPTHMAPAMSVINGKTVIPFLIETSESRNVDKLMPACFFPSKTRRLDMVRVRDIIIFLML